ncbi:hypothetical protein COU78_05635 [Candidatus Peregrinibacteria bacterium CG10_big_fil_rev_8_21_14_0_10_49_24]|nr:MAG: hypothetical protein COU78_05635 [Candidatus Peregrinibacteria bacterium CG10_big_fil_rev_8_21_14_0_10_49_24]
MRRTMRRTHQLAKQWRSSVLRWMLVFGVLSALLAVGLVLFSPLLEVREITVRRLSPRLDIESVQRVMSPLFGSHLLFLTNAEVRSLLHENINDIESVEVGKMYPSELVVTIRLHPLVSRLEIVDPDSQEHSSTATGSGMDFLTQEGVYVHTLGAVDTNALPVIRLVDWAVRPTPGTVLVPPELLRRVFDTEEALKLQFGHTIEVRTIYLRGQEYHVLADGISLWFDMRSSIERHLQRYRVLLQSVSRDDVRQYIDLRLTDRIVYQ